MDDLQATEESAFVQEDVLAVIKEVSPFFFLSLPFLYESSVLRSQLAMDTRQ